MFKYLCGALGAAALFMAPASAQAAEQCYGGGVGGGDAYVCFDVQLGLAGSTVAPSVSVRCGGTLFDAGMCFGSVLSDNIAVSVGTSGFVPNPSFEAPCVDAAGPTIRSAGGTIGTLYVNGTVTPVNVPSFFVGNPNGC